MEGKILSGRYELLELVGSGGMALVYKAKCKVLNRIVAVKILKPEFISDEEFVKRFKIEAQAAASLSHRNIISIYDVGQEDDIYYIVMEYIDGITLKEYILQNKTIDWKTALEIIKGILEALEKAHKNKIIHRDIKPHNIILTQELEPKVADFGIARATSLATATISASTIGSVHYSSPEQARGGFTDEKSDIYSVGVTLYEMLTGKLPFNAETAVAVALQHIESNPKMPMELNPDIPKSVNDIVIKAIQKKKSDRFISATEMKININRVLNNSDDIEIINFNENSTMRMEKIGDDKVAKTYKKKKTQSNKRKTKKQKSTTKKALMTGVYLLLITAIAAGSIFFVKDILLPIFNNFVGENEQKYYTVEDFTGKNFEETKTYLENEINIKVEDPKYDYSETIDEGNIIEQDPKKGNEMIIGGKILGVRFTVSKGKNEIQIPTSGIKWEDFADVQIRLMELGLNTTVEEQYSEKVSAGLVIDTEPTSGEMVKPGSTIVIYKSLGPEMVQTTVPDLYGLNKTEATTSVLRNKLTIKNMFPLDEEGHQGVVIKQEPEAGAQVTEGSYVNLYFGEIETNNSEQQSVGQNERAFIIRLKDSSQYSDKVQLKVIIKQSTRVVEDVLSEGEFDVADFPMTKLIPVPSDGKTKIKVYINGLLIEEQTFYGEDNF